MKCWVLTFTALAVLAGCDNAPDSVTSLEDLGVTPGITIDSGNRYTGRETVDIEVEGVGADSCRVWNIDESGHPQGAVVCALNDGAASLVGWPLIPGEGHRVVGMRLSGEGGLLSDVVSDSIIVDTSPPQSPEFLFPGARDSLIATDVRFRWSSAADRWCADDEIVYSFRVIGDDELLLDSERSNREAIVEGIEPGAVLTWTLTATDPAGNVGEAVGGRSVTWNVILPPLTTIPAGTFMMGSPETEPGRSGYEMQHQVTLTRAFAMANTQMTYGQAIGIMQWALDRGYASVDAVGVRDGIGSGGELLCDLRTSGIEFDGAQFSLMIEGLSSSICQEMTWYGSADVCDWINMAGGFAATYDRAGGWAATGDVYEAAGYRLPTEAEREYACRAGTETTFWNGDLVSACPCGGNPDCCCGSALLDEIAWYCANTPGYYIDLPAQKPANPWGLYDMLGGYGDWCYDTRAPYAPSAVADPVVYEGPGAHVIRGAANVVPGFLLPEQCRAAVRYEGSAGISRLAAIRLVRTR